MISTRRKLPLLLALAIGIGLGVAGSAILNPRTEERSTVAQPVRIPLGLTRQELLDALSTDYTLEVVDQKPNVHAVTLGKSGVTMALVGSADAPIRATVTAIYNRDTAQHLAVSARPVTTSNLLSP
jgi:hypothetical protein